jgi:hypothetical protein
VEGVYLPNALEAKYPNAGKKWAWFWLFQKGVSLLLGLCWLLMSQANKWGQACAVVLLRSGNNAIAQA